MLLRILLVVLLIFLGLIAISFWLPEAFLPASGPHKVPGMLQGNPLSFGHQVTGYLMGAAIGLIMALSVLTGLQRKDKTSPARRWMIYGFSGYLLVFSGLAWYYFQYQNGFAEGSFGGFPTPTAWMLFALWPFPLIFVAMLVYKFEEWFITHEELEDFRRKMEMGFPEQGGGS